MRFDQMAPYSSGADNNYNFAINTNYSTAWGGSALQSSPLQPLQQMSGGYYGDMSCAPGLSPSSGGLGGYGPGLSQQAQPVQPSYGLGISAGPMRQYENENENEPPPLPKIKNMTQLAKLFGPPDVIDTHKGGIAIWSAATLKKAGYGFLHRIEIIDESVPSVTPVKHFSNVYIWVPLSPSQEQLNNILSLSKDFFYDRKKELMIIRSDTLDTAVAQGALLLLYIKGKTSFYNLVNNDMLKTYYLKVRQSRKIKKAIYTILYTAKRTK